MPSSALSSFGSCFTIDDDEDYQSALSSVPSSFYTATSAPHNIVQNFAEEMGTSSSFFNIGMDMVHAKIPMETVTRTVSIGKKIVRIKKFTPPCLAIQGEFQSGKTAALINISLEHNNSGGVSVIIVLRNFEVDKKQTLERFQDMYRQFNERYNKDFQVYDTSTKKRITTPCVMLCLANTVSLDRVKKKMKGTKFITIVDEADFVVMPGTSDKITKTKDIIMEICDNSMRSVFVTATMFDVITQRLNIGYDSLYTLTPPSTYSGLTQYYFKEIDENSKLTSKRNGNMLDDNPFLIDYLSTLETKKPIISIRSKMPRLSLILSSTVLEPQMRLAEYINAHHPRLNTIIQDGQNGIRIYTRHILHSNAFNGRYYYYGNTISIKDAIQLFKDRNIMDNIVILAGTVAGRCCSYVSADFGSTFSEGKAWRITEAVMTFAESATIPELTQKAARGCNIQSDKCYFKLYTTLTSWRRVKRGYMATKETIERVRQIGEMTHKTLDICLKSVKLNEKKIKGIKGKRLGKGSYKMQTIVENDGGYDLEEYAVDDNDPILKSGGMTGSYTDDGGVKFVREDWMGGAPILQQHYKQTCKVILDEFGTGVWIPRSDINKKLKMFIPEGVKSDPKCYFAAGLDGFKKKSQPCEDECRPGLKIQQTGGKGGLWKIRLD